MASTDPRRNLRSWRNKRGALNRRVRAEGVPVPCYFCKQHIDLDLVYHDKGALTWHHLTPISQDGHILGDVVPAHRSCNSSFGDGTKTDLLQGQTRQW